MRALVLGLTGAMLSWAVCAQPSDSEFQAWVAKPQVNFAKLGISYWRVEEPWAEGDTVVTIDHQTIAYSAACETADFGYKQHWESEGQLEVFPTHRSSERCGKEPSKAFLRFYYLLRQSDSAKANGDAVALGQSLNVDPFVRLKRFEPEGLEFRRWTIVEYSDGVRLGPPDLHYPNYEHPTAAPETLPAPTITFSRGSLEGSPSCGALSGGYRLTGQALEIHSGLFLRGFCPPNLLKQDDRVLAAFGRVRRMDQHGAQVELRGERDEIEVILKSA
jgi:heat shock protein HslJ